MPCRLHHHAGGMIMTLWELFVIAVGLSMDAFAVSVCKGLSLGKIKWKHMCIAGLWFGGFQALMPAIGYFLGSFFTVFINKYSHWVAFILLLIIGGNMIKEALSKEEEEVDASMTIKSMFILAIATSIDALAVGVTFACMKVQIVWAVLFIGVVTFTLSAVGVKVGSLFGMKYKSKAELFGGMVLILIGLKILLQGLGIINFN
jgi:putative Mn2+ efflux pump MntP